MEVVKFFVLLGFAINYGYMTSIVDHKKLLKCLAYEPAQIDELVDRSGFTASEVASMLLILELEGCVVSESGLYTRVA